ncbi:MAG TPA: hypothetical protein VGM77_07045 [Gemmatimonadales bacterium]
MRILVAAGVLILSSASATAARAQFRQGPVGKPIAGISCDAMEGSRIHIHQHLVILDHGKSVAIPFDVGRPASANCLYWIHTHTPDGIIHIEAPANRSFTLGDFFAIWGEPLSRLEAASAKGSRTSPLRIWVDGKRYLGDPRMIALVAHADITIEAGPPFSTPVPFTAWGTL